MAKPFHTSAALLAAVIGFNNAVADDDKPAAPKTMVVKLRDSCDPPTFNAVIGPGACVGTFRTTFEQFITELNQDQTVGSWRFHPLQFRANNGTRLVITNLGGELHTFTQVREFGGGFVGVLNQASGTPTPAPECAAVVNGELVPQPPSASNLFVAAGATVAGPTINRGKQVKYQCCIHPWMRTTVNPKGDDHDD